MADMLDHVKLDLIEFVTVDNESTHEEGVYRNVLILGNKSKNSRQYSAEAMRNAVSLYEGIAVYQDHPSPIDRERKGRSAADRFGSLQNVRFVESAAGPQLRGDMPYLKTHPFSPNLKEDQERHLNCFGLSHLADGTGQITTKDGRRFEMVESIDRVKEVDVVSGPATTLNLREQAESVAVTGEPIKPTEEDKKERERDEADMHADRALESGVMAILRDPDTSIEQKEGKIKQLFATHLEVHEEEEKDEEAEENKEVKAEKKEEKEEKKEVAEQAATLQSLTEQLATLQTTLKEQSEQIALIRKRKYLPGGDASQSLALAEQAAGGGNGNGRSADPFPEKGTVAEKRAWLRRPH